MGSDAYTTSGQPGTPATRGGGGDNNEESRQPISTQGTATIHNPFDNPDAQTKDLTDEEVAAVLETIRVTVDHLVSVYRPGMSVKCEVSVGMTERAVGDRVEAVPNNTFTYRILVNGGARMEPAIDPRFKRGAGGEDEPAGVAPV